MWIPNKLPHSNSDGTGIYISGHEYDFTYKVSGDTLTVTFEEDDIEEYTELIRK